MLHVQTTPPHPKLQGFIRAYVQRESQPVDPPIVEPVVARLGAVLEFQFGDPYNVPLYGSEEPNLSAPVAVIGPITERRARVLIQGRVQALAVLFQPLGFNALSRISSRELADIGIDAHGVLGASAARLHQELGSVARFSDRTQRLDRFFLRQLEDWQPDPVRDVLRSMMGPMALSVRQAAHAVNLSARQLERRSVEYAGVAPKMLARIARFERALRLKCETKRPWTEIAYEADYYDQMHMIRDFHAFSTESPAAVLSKITQYHLLLISPSTSTPE